MKNCCINCPDKTITPNCHNVETCEKYKEYKAYLSKVYEERCRERALDAFYSQRARRFKNRK